MGKKPPSRRQRAFWAGVVLLTGIWLLSCVTWTCFQFNDATYKVVATRSPNGLVTTSSSGRTPIRVDLGHGVLMIGWGTGNRVVRSIDQASGVMLQPILTPDFSSAAAGVHMWGWYWQRPMLIPTVRLSAAALPLWIPPTCLVVAWWVRRLSLSPCKPPYSG